MSPLNELFDEMDEIMDKYFGKVSYPHLVLGKWRPAMDVYELSKKIVIIVELAGVEKDKIDVKLNGNILTISGLRQAPTFSEGMTLHQMEIDFGKFRRSIKISIPIRADEIKAKFEEGFLWIDVPKELGNEEK